MVFMEIFLSKFKNYIFKINKNFILFLKFFNVSQKKKFVHFDTNIYNLIKSRTK